MNHRHAPVLEVVRNRARRLDDPERDLDALIQAIGQRPFVLLGEASHGTHEFYDLRASLTRRLLGQHGFDAVALEADWPDALSLNRHVRGESGISLDTAFAAFERFPTWMWRNRPMHAFVDWLAQHNARLPMAQRCGIYGLDLYSLYRSADAVIQYLEQVDPEQAMIARQMYAALDHVRDPQDYGMQAAAGLRPSCRSGAAGMLVELLRKAPQYLASDGLAAAERQFEAERNASVVMNAEHYYRAMFGRRQNTWNLRDAHMVETLQALRRHLRQLGREGRIVVWAHNSHLGDARATQMGQRGEWNIGQLMREHAGTDQVYSVGFTTHTGHVTAARDWDHPAERRWVRPSRSDSYEHLFYRTGLERFVLQMGNGAAEKLSEPLLERAIGVIYRPETELPSHYFSASIAHQFDAIIHLDETTAVEPIDINPQWTRHEPAETWPSGL